MFDDHLKQRQGPGSTREALEKLANSVGPLPEAERVRQLGSALEELALRLDEQTRKEEALVSEILELDRRLRRVEESVVFRTLRAVGGQAQSLTRRVGRAILRSRLRPLFLRLRREPALAQDYRQWLEAHRSSFSSLPDDSSTWPSISILLPVCRPQVERLRQAIESVVAQTFPNWQLCVAVDGELSTAAQALINQFVQADPRIIRTGGQNLGISESLNLALSKAHCDFVTRLDQEDVLEPAMLAQFAMSLQSEPVDLIYSDEDFTDQRGVPDSPNFKPSFSPELLLSCMYLGRSVVMSRLRLKHLGGFRPRFDGAEDYDVALRLLSEGGRFRHLPKVLYHRRGHSRFAANRAAESAEHAAGHRALQDYLNRIMEESQVEDGPLRNTYQIRWPTAADSVCSIIVPSRTAAFLGRFLKQVRATTDRARVDIVVVHHLSTPAEDARIEDLARSHQCRRVAYAGAFNHALMSNLGANSATGDLLVFMNDDVSLFRSGWLERITGHLSRPQIGVVGAHLRYPDGSIQHAGIALGLLHASGHVGRFLFDSPCFPWINFSRDVTAVTGACLGVRRELFDRLGGFDVRFRGDFNDVDFCLRVREAGLNVILDRKVELTHLERATKGHCPGSQERLLFLQRWRDNLVRPDPYFSPHLKLDSEQPGLSIS